MYEWQLDDLYVSYESEDFKADWKKLNQFKEDFSELSLKDNLESIKAAVKFKEDLLITARRIGAYISLTLSTNTTDEISTNYRGQYSQILSELTKSQILLDRFLGSVTSDITQDSELSEYTFAFKELKEEAAHLLDEETEAVISKMNISGASAWSNLHTFLTSTVETDVEGKTFTLSEIRNLAYDANQDIRKKAYHAELDMYNKIKDPIAFSLNNIKQQVLTTSSLRGYESPLDETLQKSRMDRRTLESLITAIKKYLPEFRRYLKQKATYLGHENGLPFYDLFAPMGETSQQFTVEESGDYLVDHFRPFSDKLADLVATFYENDYVDFIPRKGKRGGAFCSNLPFIGQSRIMTNFDGSLSSVITMAHELGHAYHGSIIQSHKPLNWSYSMPVAETASTFNETLIMNDLLNNTNDEVEKLALIESLLQDTTQIIVDIYSRYYFESKVFEAKEDTFLFSQQLEELMKEAQLEAYGDGLDSNYLHPYMWVNKGHYYSAGLSFYNFPYAFGGLFARGLYSIYEQQPEGFVERYDELLKLTTVSTVEDTAKVMNIDVTDVAFWEKSLDTFVEYIDQFETITNKLMSDK
ncbi:M3 family oligoendopeptidase [Aerococcaceae bacterium DSM 111021]|nr:M3 family oligoendopeptidase [Aerococcaceae bacterium DSM 111021]